MIISSARTITSLTLAPRKIIVIIVYEKPQKAIHPRKPINLKRSLVKRKSTGFGYIIERTS